MEEMIKRYKLMQGIHYTGVPIMEREIMEWHKKINTHKVRVDEDFCTMSYVLGSKADNLSIRQVCNASKNGELQIKMNYYSAETGRSTTTGVNIQGLKKGCAGRRAIIPNAGKVFVKVDSSSIEPRCLAVLAQEKSLIDLLQNGKDIYEEFGKSVGLDRAEGKIAFLASMYGQGRSGIISLFNMFGKNLTEDMAKKIKYGFCKKYPKITGGYKKTGGLWQDVFDGLLSNSYIKLPSGRFINYRPVYVGENKYGGKEYNNIETGEKETRLWFGRAVNNYVQGTARDVFFWQVSQMVKGLNGIADICWTVHDDAVFECDEKYLDITKKVLEVCAGMSPNWLCFDKIFKGKISIGKNYEELGE